MNVFNECSPCFPAVGMLGSLEGVGSIHGVSGTGPRRVFWGLGFQVDCGAHER